MLKGQTIGNTDVCLLVSRYSYVAGAAETHLPERSRKKVQTNRPN